MKQVLHFGGTLQQSSGWYGNPWVIGTSLQDLSDAEARVVMPTSGTIRNFRMRLTAAPGAGFTRTIAWVKNGSVTSLSITISDSATEGSDPVNSVSVAPGDTISVFITRGALGSPAASDVMCAFEFETSGNESVYGFGGQNTQTASTRYTGLFFARNISSGWPADVEDNASALTAVAGNVTGYRIRANNAPGAGKSWAFAIYKNGVKQDGTGGTVDTTSSIADAGTTATASFTLPVSVGDVLSVQVVPSGTPTAARLNGMCLFAGGSELANYGTTVAAAPTGSATRFYWPYGYWPIAGATTESSREQVIPSAVQFASMIARATDAGGLDSALTITLRKDGADTALTLSISGSSPAVGSVSADVDAVAGTELALQVTAAGAIGGATIFKVVFAYGPPDEIIEPPPDDGIYDCNEDESGAGRGGALIALLVDIGSVSADLADYPVPGSVATAIQTQPHAAPSSLSVAVQAGGTSLVGTAYYAIATVHDGVLSELSAVQSATTTGTDQRVQLSWSGLASGADFVRVYRGRDANFLQFDRYRVSGYPYAESDVPASESGVIDLYPGYDTIGDPPTPDGADPHWDLNYRQNKAYMVSALYDDGVESACSAAVQANLWPRNAPLSVEVSWAAPGAGPATLTGYRVRRMNATYHYEFVLDRQWDFDSSTTDFIDPNDDTTAASGCATTTGGKPVYCLAGHTLKQVRAVYVHKPHPVTGEMAQVLMEEGVDYTQEVREVNGNRYHCLIFNEPQRSDTCEYYEVSADVDGVESNADGTGVLLTNIDDIWEHILFNIIFNTYRSSVGQYAPSGGKWFYDVPYSPGLIDRDSIAAARAIGVTRFPSDGYPGGGLLIEQVNARELIHDLLVSADLMFYQHNGVWFTKRLDTNVVRSTLPQITPEDDIFRETFEPFLLTEKQVNQIPFFGGPIAGNPDRGWLVASELQDDVSVELYRRVIISEPIYLLWIQSSAAAFNIITHYLRRLRYPPIGASFSAVINRYSLPPGSLVRVTHPDGLGPSGWVDRVCMVLGNELDFDTLTCRITVRDIDDLIPV